MEISIIILNYNGLELLQKCIPSVINAVTKYGNICDILVVDNGSQDESRQYIKSNFPFIRILELKNNLGFAKAINLGLKETTSQIAIILNNDVIVEENFIYPLVNHFIHNEDIFAVGAKLLYWDKETLNFGRTSGSFRYGFFTRKIFDWPLASNTLYACAGGIAVDKNKFLSLGGFDEDLNIYWEDLDICYRAWKRGLKTIYEPESVIYHKVHGTNEKVYGQHKIDMISGENYSLFIVKNIHDSYFFYKHLLSIPLLLILSCLKGKSHFAFGVIKSFRNLGLFWKKRCQETQNIIVGDRKVLSLSNQ